MLYLLFLLILSPLSADGLFSSNGLGQKGESVTSISDSLWVIELTDTERRLYKEGELYKRWSYSTLQEKGRSYDKEEYYFGTELRTVSIIDSQDKLIRELLYDSRGDFMVDNRFSYKENRLVTISQFDEAGELLKEQDLAYRSDGSLRTLRAGGDERVAWRAASFSERYLDALFLEEGDRSSLYAYEEGRIKFTREDHNGSPVKKSEFRYASDGSLEKETVHNFHENSRILRYYDRDGNIVLQNLYRDEDLVKTESSTYSAGRLTVREEQTEKSRMRLEYDYREGESDPHITRQYINGILVKESENIEEGVKETLYRRGEAVLTRILENEQ